MRCWYSASNWTWVGGTDDFGAQRPIAARSSSVVPVRVCARAAGSRGIGAAGGGGAAVAACPAPRARRAVHREARTKRGLLLGGGQHEESISINGATGPQRRRRSADE